MRIISHLSLQCVVVSLVALNTLTAACAIPFRSGYIAFDRRTLDTVTVNGKVAELGAQLSLSSHGKSTVWRLNKWDGKANPGYVIKKYNRENVDIEHEVAGLEAVGQFIAFDPVARVLVMKEVKGRTLAEMMAELPHDQRKDFLNKWRPKVAKAAAAIAKSKGVYHKDMNMDNIIVDGSNNVQFVDWELYYTPRDKSAFKTDEKAIEMSLEAVWDSSKTPHGFTKSKSPGASGKKSSSPRGSPSKKSRSRSSGKKSGSPKRRSPRAHRREAFYD